MSKRIQCGRSCGLSGHCALAREPLCRGAAKKRETQQTNPLGLHGNHLRVHPQRNGPIKVVSAYNGIWLSLKPEGNFQLGRSGRSWGGGRAAGRYAKCSKLKKILQAVPCGWPLRWPQASRQRAEWGRWRGKRWPKAQRFGCGRRMPSEIHCTASTCRQHHCIYGNTGDL